MGTYDTAYYLNYGNGSSTGYYAVAQWAASTAYVVGNLRRQLATPSVGSERVFICTVAGTSGGSAPSWVLTEGNTTTDNTVTWMDVTGKAGVNGDTTNTPTWSQLLHTGSDQIPRGTIIKNNAATHLFIVTTSNQTDNTVSEPSFNTTTGQSTNSGNTTYLCIGAINAFSNGAAPFASFVMDTRVTNKRVFIADNHAEVGRASAVSPSWGGSTVICHDHTASYPPAAANITTGAQVSIAGTVINIEVAGNLYNYIEGVTFTVTGSLDRVNVGTITKGILRCKNCVFELGASAQVMTIGQASGSNIGSLVELDNCSFKFGSASQSLSIQGGIVRWKNSRAFASGSTIPTAFITGTAANGDFQAIGVDFSDAGSGKTLFSADIAGNFSIIDCKLNASVTLMGDPGSAQTPARLHVINCDSGTKNYRNEIYGFTGSIFTETTIVRTDGASDGTTPYAKKMVSSSLCSYPIRLLDGPPIAVWNETVGSAITVTLYGIWGNGAVPNDDEFWIDVYYLGSSATPIASLISSQKATVITAASALSGDSSTWGGSTTKFKASVTFTPQMKGLIHVVPRLAKASTTLYYDPKLAIS